MDINWQYALLYEKASREEQTVAREYKAGQEAGFGKYYEQNCQHTEASDEVYKCFHYQQLYHDVIGGARILKRLLKGNWPYRPWPAKAKACQLAAGRTCPEGDVLRFEHLIVYIVCELVYNEIIIRLRKGILRKEKRDGRQDHTQSNRTNCSRQKS